MAKLDLFANFERTSNDTLFYREISAIPHSILFKVVDLDSPESNLIEYYQAEYSINNSSVRYPMIDLQTCQHFLRVAPCLSSVTVYVSALDDLTPIRNFATNATSLTAEYSLSAKYIQPINQADFISYPTYVIHEPAGTIQQLNSTNYTQSSGVYFYGEGHTETMNFSANGSTTLWFIGNTLSSIKTQPSIKPVTNVNTYTATVPISGAPAEHTIYPVTVKILTTEINSNGTVFTYDDLTGEQKLYKFVASSLHPSGSASELNGRFRNSIEVKPYPDTDSYTIVSTLSSSNRLADQFFYPDRKYAASLPYDYRMRRYLANVIEIPSPSRNFLSEELYATKWELGAVAEEEPPNPDWNVETTVLYGVSGYNFPMGYYNKKNINDVFFKSSAVTNTVVTIGVSAQVATQIDKFPAPNNDWLCRTVPHKLVLDQEIERMPTAAFFTSSYYYITGENVKFHNIIGNWENIDVLSISASASNTTDILYFEQGNTPNKIGGFDFVSFTDIGVVSLTATINFIDKKTQTNYSITSIVQDFIEIVPFYDEIDEKSFISSNTSPNCLNQSYPKITPNEWVTEDNINALLDKHRLAIEELETFSRPYSTNSLKLLGRLESVMLPADPKGSCLGKHCLDWKWSSRECKSSSVYTDWDNTSSGKEFVKKWEFEPCELLFQEPCSREDSWVTPYLNSATFNDWICSNDRINCKYTGIVRLNESDKIVVSYEKELHLLDNDYYASTGNMAKRLLIDDVYKFQNIVGISLTTDEKVVVLDGELSRISVFSIDHTNTFVLLHTWGQFGLLTSKTGFNQPLDVHVDSNNFVWIADAGNRCVKKLTLTGKHLSTISNDVFIDNAPISICVDVDFNLHCLTENSIVYVFDSEGGLKFSYSLPEGVKGNKINVNYNKYAVYVTDKSGIYKFYKNGIFSHSILKDFECLNEDSTASTLQDFGPIVQDKHRVIYTAKKNTLIKITDRMVFSELVFDLLTQQNKWDINSIYIDREEYIQPWVYIKAFHRLWDNVELLRSSLFYQYSGCKQYRAPVYTKEDIKLGQNEIVTNATINRMSEQLWSNIQTLAKYFDATCKN